MATADFLVHDKNGNRVNVGDEITDFRGETAYFRGVSRGPEYNGTAKVLSVSDPETDRFGERENYDRVFDLTVTRKAGTIKWMNHGSWTWFDNDGTCIADSSSRRELDKMRDELHGY